VPALRRKRQVLHQREKTGLALPGVRPGRRRHFARPACARCDFREAVQWLAGAKITPKRSPAPAAVDPPKPAGEDSARSLKIAARIVGELVPLRGTPGEPYLGEIRKIDVAAIATCLSARMRSAGILPFISTIPPIRFMARS
jgi:hypothetical protein